MDHRHWSMLPFGIQKTVVRLWNNGKPLPGYAEACASAIDQVVDRCKTG